MSNKTIALIILLTTLVSCQKEYTQDDCEIFSMKAWKGLPKPATLFRKHCGKYTIHYSGPRCQRALKDMIMENTEEQLKKRHGKEIMHCFSQNDIKKFLVVPKEPKEDKSKKNSK